MYQSSSNCNLFFIIEEYEIAFGKIAENGVLKYEDILKYFAECGHHPSEKEIDDAIGLVTKGINVYCACAARNIAVTHA